MKNLATLVLFALLSINSSFASAVGAEHTMSVDCPALVDSAVSNQDAADLNNLANRVSGSSVKESDKDYTTLSI